LASSEPDLGADNFGFKGRNGNELRDESGLRPGAFPVRVFT
jgi:hypothetical protein